MFSFFAKPRRVLVDIRREGGDTQLWFGGAQLDLSKLSSKARASLATLATTLAVEADLKGNTVVGLGETKVHPRTGALRAVEDNRWADAREYLTQLGDAVDTDSELLCARMALNSLRGTNLERDFLRLLSLPGVPMERAEKAFGLLGALQAHCAPAFVAFAERATDCTGSRLARALSAVPRPLWGQTLPARALVEQLDSKPLFDSNLTEAETYLSALERHPESETWAARIAEGWKKVRKRDERAAKALLASRPDFDDVEARFGHRLPAALRSAWHASYEGAVVGWGFIRARKGGLDRLLAQAQALERTLAGDERGHRVLPFALGEHDGDFFALDLSQPAGDDFAVIGFFNHGAGGYVVAYPTSAAWLRADGAPVY